MNGSFVSKAVFSLAFVVLFSSVSFAECVPSWSCEDWTVCYKGSQSQTCRNGCESPSVSYELRSCGDVFVPAEEKTVSNASEAPSSMTGMSVMGLSGNVFIYVLFADAILLVLGVMTWKWKHIEPHFRKKRSR